MMEHILQYDWCSPVPDSNFLNENEIDNCNIERIIRNKFHDPTISSDEDEDSDNREKINWDQVFKRKEKVDDRPRKLFVPALRAPPQYLKLSALSIQQHYQCLKVLCAQNPEILPQEMIPRPTKGDYKVFEAVKETYENEQKEFIEWAKTMWMNSHCGRTLRPKPTIEMVYEAEFKIRAKELESFPKTFRMAAYIPLENKNIDCTMEHVQDLIDIKLAGLPKISLPEMIVKKFDIIRPCPVPEPCTKHPCRFKMPNENKMSELPLTEVHKELAHYAHSNGVQYIASESALKCLVETDKFWLLPVSVCNVTGIDGEKQNILVFGSDFASQKQSGIVRTYKAFRHLLEYAIIPPEEKARVLGDEMIHDKLKGMETLRKSMDNMDMMTDDDDDDDEGHLVIQTDDDDDMPLSNTNDSIRNKNKESESIQKQTGDDIQKTNETTDNSNKGGEFYTCACKDSTFENPPPRSYRKWRIRNSKNKESVTFIAHCSHKMRDENGEIIAEPLPEYQIELGGSRQTDHKMRSIALSLFLREKASLLNARIEASTGDLVTINKITKEEFMKQHGDFIKTDANLIFETFTQLQGLMPGQYILQHEPSHGENAFLYAPSVKRTEKMLNLNFDISATTEHEDTKLLKSPPLISPILMPLNKFRKILPCAFTPFESMLAKESKKPGVRQKTPPQAIKEADVNAARRKWPKRNKNRKRKGTQ